MHVPVSGPGWLQALRAGAVVPPLVPRLPLRAGGAVLGSMAPGLVCEAGLDTLCGDDGKPLLRALPADAGWAVEGDATGGLARMAAQLRDKGMAGAWRNEQLAVNDADGARLATLERGAVRTLGITTQAVHLVGVAADGCFWVQQRAFDKANDPGLWDTLMGGMVSAVDTVETALVRETWEEAGLHLAQLQHMRPGGRLKTARPSTDGHLGYVVEDVDWFVCTVPQGVEPVNQDGEVAQFVRVPAQEVLARLERGDFTTEAALILSDVMGL